MIKLRSAHVSEMTAHAQAANPAECCGLIGGTRDYCACSVYPLHNVAPDPLVAYEAAAVDLFAAQKSMRARGEQLLAIYHSHPRARDPVPSVADVRLAYYPSAIYFIIGLSGADATLRAFRIGERAGQWEPIDFHVIDEGEEMN